MGFFFFSLMLPYNFTASVSQVLFVLKLHSSVPFGVSASRHSHVRAHHLVNNIRDVFCFIDQQMIVLAVAKNTFRTRTCIELNEVLAEIKIKI